MSGWRLLASPPIVLNLVFFILLSFCGGGLNQYLVAALSALYATPPAIANMALTGLLTMSAVGVLVGGMLTGFTSRHSLITATGLAVTSISCMLVGLIDFSAAVLAMDYSAVFGGREIPADSYFPFFFPSPASGSACKRLCMYLRWMVRPADGIDLGLWREVSAAKLVIPVDAHIQRISRYLGLTNRKQADWRMAREITQALRRLDPADPVKYDFSLCHLGISEGCDGRDRVRCTACPINELCTAENT